MEYKYDGNKEDFKILIQFLLKHNFYEDFNKIISYLYHDFVIRDVYTIFDDIKTTYSSLLRIHGCGIDPNLQDLYVKMDTMLDAHEEWNKFFFGYNQERFRKEWIEWLDALHKVSPDKISMVVINGRPCLQLRMRDKYGNACKIGPLGNDIIDKEFPSYLKKHLMVERMADFFDDDTFLILKHNYIF